MVIVKKVCVTINNQEILNDVYCTLPQGRITTFIGKSGAGKTTVLRACADLIKPTSGNIEIDGISLAECNAPLCDAPRRAQRCAAQKIGFVFQDFNLFAHMTVLQNCIDPLLIQGITRTQAEERTIELLRRLEIADKRDQYPCALSGGQQQRVAIARALCLQPSVLLLDEPTASLDPINTEILAQILQQLAQQGLTVACSTQDMQFAKNIRDHVYYMEQGRIIEEYDNAAPQNECPNINAFLK